MSNPDWRPARFRTAERKRQFRQELGGRGQPFNGDIDVSLGAVLAVGFVMALGTAAVIIGR